MSVSRLSLRLVLRGDVVAFLIALCSFVTKVINDKLIFFKAINNFKILFCLLESLDAIKFKFSATVSYSDIYNIHLNRSDTIELTPRNKFST